MINNYRHKRTGIIVKSVIEQPDLGYFSETDPQYHLPKGVVEQSTEWEEIIPVIDFFGKVIDTSKVHYFVVVDQRNVSHVINDIKANNEVLFTIKAKKITAFKEYEDACKFQKIYNALRNDKELLITPTGNPTTYLKNLLKTL